MKYLVSIYKSPKRDEMYLYLNKRDKLTAMPDSLKQVFGEPVHVVDMLLTPEKKLARADTGKVLSELEERGYYLQMPPQQDEYIEHLPDELLTMNDPL
ncbi:hypothetical protein ACH42_15870 [Endozoicomonas sp. (ex Bugula neritina AB1)]|nr:hypothetical protein ACH42_15870 [Endozoicomonas sp. (ex Bugula neritina AB1)]